MKKILNLMLIFALVFSLLIGCSNNQADQLENNAEFEQTNEVNDASATDNESVDSVAINSMGETFVYDKIPEKIFTNETNLLEILIELGLGDKVVVFAGGEFNPEDALEKNREVIGDINYLGDYVALESVVDSGADFIYINPTSFSDKISINEFTDKGISVYACRANYIQAATIEDVYEDVLNLGRIFRIEDKAQDVVENMRKEARENITTVNSGDEKPRVLVYDLGESEVFTAGLGLESSLISLAGGKNIFSDIARPWTKVSWEEVVARDPQIIIIHEYPRKDSCDDKIAFLMENDILKDVDAIKNERFIKLPMINIFTGMQINDGIRLMNQAFNAAFDE